MHRWHRLFFICLLLLCDQAFAQPASVSAKTSDKVVVYDKTTYQPVGGSAIPFDSRFTLQIPHYGSASVTKVFVYWANFDGGKRQIIPRKIDSTIKPDLDLPFKESGDTLNIYFPAIKPSCNFEVAVVSNLTGSLLPLAYQLNEDIAGHDYAQAALDHKVLVDSTTDNALRIRSFQYSKIADYLLFYRIRLDPLYGRLLSHGLYRMVDFPDITAIGRLETSFSVNKLLFKDNNRLVQILSDHNQRAVLEGTRTVKYDNSSRPITLTNFAGRMANLQASLVFFDTLNNTINAALAIYNDPLLLPIKANIKAVTDALNANKRMVQGLSKSITDIMTTSSDLSSVDVLVGSTRAKDIKTAGGNIITMDLGLSNIVTLNTKNQLKYIPKPYYGINIYFRPIDKNTREKDFEKNVPTNGDPQYRIVSINDWRQHLSIGIGLTFTGMTNPEFDNLFNSATLMIGPGYRWGRFVKFGTGLALLKRNSKDPLVRDKKVIGGYYISMSADIDFVQGIKDFVSIIFK